MSEEKKIWRLSTPFRQEPLQGKQDLLRRKAKLSRPENRISSVYLSDGSATNAFIVIPEFDDPIQTRTTPEEVNHAPPLLKFPTVSSSSSTNSVDSLCLELQSTESRYSSHISESSSGASDVSSSQDDDLPQRLNSAYEHIRSMSSVTFPKTLLSADPQMRRKQLGVPQHSVLNYPIHSSPDLPNPHSSLHDLVSSIPPAVSSPDMSHTGTSKPGLCAAVSSPPLQCVLDPLQPIPSVVSTPTESLFSQSSIPVSCSSQSYVSNPSKLSKYREDAPITPPSSPPSPRRQAARNGLRKSPSTDLPNLYASLHDPTLSIPRPVSYPDMSHTGMSDPGLRATASLPPLQCVLDSLQPPSVASTPTKSFSSQCSMPALSCPQPHAPNSSKFSKRRDDKPITPPSSLPSSRRQAARNVLRKPVTPTLTSSPGAHRREMSLPQIRPPSPFRVNMPLHQTWHERRTNFNSSPECRYWTDHKANTRRTSGSTEFLASLAWTGTPPVLSNINTTDRKRQPAASAYLSNRFSMASAIEDDSMSDDVLVDQLEKVLKIDGVRESVLSKSDDVHFPRVGEDKHGFGDKSFPPFAPTNNDQPTKSDDGPPHSSPTSNNAASDSEDAAVRKAASKALLCIREIVQTEKRYQEALKMLLNAQTATPPPPSMTPYVSALICASEVLLKYFVEDPSAWGVSTAFVTCEDELEETMVSWCAVAGGFFTDENDPQSSRLMNRWRLRKSGMSSSSSSTTNSISSSSPLSPLSPQLPPLFSMTNLNSKLKMKEDEESSQDRQISPVSRPGSSNSRSSTSQPPSRKPSVRDLAIQPIQRVMRYVLLYRDLRDYTPSMSPSRLLVERALEAATRIADRCDRAQSNPAFCHAS